MHETHVTQDILKETLKRAEHKGAKRVVGATIRLGELSGFMPDSIEAYFESFSRGTIAENAKLEFVPLPPTASCRKCGADVPTKEDELRCPKCGSKDLELKSGREVYVESIEVI